MPILLHVDASARGSRSHTRRLGRLFTERWGALRPHDQVIARDVGRNPPSPVTEAWVAAAFTKRRGEGRPCTWPSPKVTARR